jgi:hypothetical protein
MKLTTSFLLIVAIGVLASCNGVGNFAPVVEQQQTSTPENSLLQSLLPAGIDPRASFMCTTPTYKPKQGPFIVFVANGKAKKTTFKSKPSTLTLWLELKIKKSTKPTPPPKTPPPATPSPPPMTKPTYFYYGQYTLAKAKQAGCVLLFTTQSGKPFAGSKFSGLIVGSPKIAYPTYYKEKLVAKGPVSIKISKLSASGGIGSATLKLQNGSTFDTAKITLTYRFAAP